jgi:hypothetical protein
MYLKCAHPECSSDFDPGQGRIYRFQQSPRHGPLPANSHSVKHFWLCTKCRETFTIDYQEGVGVLLPQRLETLAEGQPSHFVLLEENVASRKLTRRSGRNRTRERKRKSELTPVQTNAIEILRNRNMERKG